MVIRRISSGSEVAPDNALVIVESTIRPATCTSIVALGRKKGKRIHLALPGRAIQMRVARLVFNDRVIGLGPVATQRAVCLRSFVQGNCGRP